MNSNSKNNTSEVDTASTPRDTGETASASAAPIRQFDDYRWQQVDLKVYKEDGRDLFRDVTRQVLFSRSDLAGELRYFQVAPNGYTTLERHEHVHAVLILRGSGRALIGDTVAAFATNDLITVPPMIWHQFRASPHEPMGFLCMVDAIRDKPQLPSAEDLARFEADAAIAAFLAGN